MLSVKDGAQTVWYAICNNSFSVSHGGRANVNDHIQTKKHKTSQAASSSSCSITSFFSKTEPTHDGIKLAAAEGVFAYYTVKHNHSFRSMNCTTKLVKKLFDQKFSSARTKTEAIVSNVLAPYSYK